MNDEFRSAAWRGVLHAILVALAAFLSAWTTTTDARVLWSATLLPAVTVLGVRWIGEGWTDTVKARRRGTPEHAARQARLAKVRG